MDYIKFFSALLTPTIAVITTYIAYQQYKANKLKIKNDLYDRRLAIYNSIIKPIGIVLRTANINEEQFSEFFTKTRESYFLFDENIPEYIDQIYSKLTELIRINTSENAEARFAKERQELLEWFFNQGNIARDKFKPYLNLNS